MIIAKAPVRMSFVGGGSDLKSFYQHHPGAVVSTAIDKYVYVTVNDCFDESIKIKYSEVEKVEHIDHLKHDRAKEILRLLGIANGIEVSTLADIPSKGTGLGSSSTFTVAMLHAIHAHKGEHVSAKTLAEEACRIEIDILGEPIGPQDQYAAAHGGLNFIQFNSDDTVVVNPIVCQKETLKKLEDNLIIFYTGITRSASSILSEQKKNCQSDSAKIETMKKMVQLAYDLKEELEKNRIKNFGKILHENWILKKQMAGGISSGDIDRWYDAAIDAGAEGGKLLGAGGGGFMLFYAPKSKHSGIKSALSELRPFDFNFEREGSKIIFIHD